MVKTPVKQRNLSLECCRILGACFVVFLHVPFPGEFGGLVACLSRFAVPMFFAISGWYSYQTKPQKLLKRMKAILLLELSGIALQLAWNCVQGTMEGVRMLDTLRWKIPEAAALGKWLVFQVDPFSGPLWYLSAAAVCYLVLAVYVRICKTDYRPLYVLSGIALAAHFAMAEFSRFTGIRVDFTVYRNAWFFGIPMFTMGLALRQLRENLSETGKENAVIPLAVMLLGTALSILEWRIFGGFDLPVGTVIAVAGLMLLTAARPAVPRWLEKAAGSFGFLSTGVYLVHLIVRDVYGWFFSWKLEAVLGESTAWAVPLLVAGVSFGLAAAAYFLRRLASVFVKRCVFAPD